MKQLRLALATNMPKRNGDPGGEAPLRQRVRALVTNRRFEHFIIAVIILNAVTLGLETSATVSAAIGPQLAALDTCFIAIFVVELALKIYAHGLRFYRDPWSWFDTVIVAISLIPQSGSLSVLRALRILRVLRLISVVPALRRVVASLLTAIPSMGAILLLLALINYVFAVMATKLFGDRFPEWFGTLGASLYTLFQIMTLESWSMGIVRPVMEVYPLAWLLFVPYIMIVTFAVLNLFIGIVVDAMQSQAHETQDAVIEITKSEYQSLAAEIAALRADIRGLVEKGEARDGGTTP
ncbi:MAG: ion transporter [Hyphomicrobiaceae bacterium]